MARTGALLAAALVVGTILTDLSARLSLARADEAGAPAGSAAPGSERAATLPDAVPPAVPTAVSTVGFSDSPGVPADLRAIIDRSCRDCHGGPTRWPWYSKFPPGSWIVRRHIEEGTGKLDLSAWGAMDPRARAHALEEMGEEVGEKKMPLPAYLWLHRAARLTPAERTRFVEWTEAERARLEGRDQNGAARSGGQER